MCVYVELGQTIAGKDGAVVGKGVGAGVGKLPLKYLHNGHKLVWHEVEYHKPLLL